MLRRRWLMVGLLLLLVLVGVLGWFQQNRSAQSETTASGAMPVAAPAATPGRETNTGDAVQPGALSLAQEPGVGQASAPAPGDATAEPRQPSAPGIRTPPAQAPAIAHTRTVPAGGYTPGAPLDIQLALDYPAEGMPITALGVAETIPRGWTFGEVTSEPKPEISPPPGARLHLEFAWTKIPAFPLNFTYTVNVPASEGGGTREIVGRTLFRAEGPEGRSRESITKLTRK